MSRRFFFGPAVALFLVWLRWFYGAEPNMPSIVGWGLLLLAAIFTWFAIAPERARLKLLRRQFKIQNPIIFDRQDGRWQIHPLVGDEFRIIIRRGFSTRAMNRDAYDFYLGSSDDEQRRMREFVYMRPRWHWTKEELESARPWKWRAE
jgi:hypothetical protein